MVFVATIVFVWSLSRNPASHNKLALGPSKQLSSWSKREGFDELLKSLRVEISVVRPTRNLPRKGYSKTFEANGHGPQSSELLRKNMRKPEAPL
jgi:hypothetical protein